MSEGGNIIRIIGGKSTWTSEEDMNIIATDGDVTFYSPQRVNIEGEQDGQKFGIYDFEEENTDDEKYFPTGYWSYDFEGKNTIPGDSNHLYRTTLERTVYLQINVSDNVPSGTLIKFQLWEKDAFGITDDSEFNEKEVFKVAEVREINGKKRISIKLFLENIWKKEIAKDKGAFQNGCIELFWKWNYGNISWHSRDVELSVYPSEFRLRIKAALNSQTNALPEIYSHKGDIICFAIEQLPNGKIEKFVTMKLRTTTTFRSIEGINKFKKEVFTETIDLKRNRLETSSYNIEDVEHIFTIKKEYKDIYIEEKLYNVPIAKGSDIAIYNSIKKVVNFGKIAADTFGQIQILDEMRNMIPELSNNGEFNKPSLSTFVGFIPGAQVIAFGVGVLEWIAQDYIKEMKEWVDEQMWIDWQNEKAKGLNEARNFINNYWAIDNHFQAIEISQRTLNLLLKGNFNSINELKDDIYNGNIADILSYTVFFHRINEEAIEDYFDVLDCIFINEI